MTDKSNTNKKWVSNKKYRNNHDVIFKAKKTLSEEILFDKWKEAEKNYAENQNDETLERVRLARLALKCYTEEGKR